MCLYPHSHSLYQYSNIMTIGEGWNVHPPVNKEPDLHFRLPWYLKIQYNGPFKNINNNTQQIPIFPKSIPWSVDWLACAFITFCTFAFVNLFIHVQCIYYYH